jgi:hypothetical protein
MPGFSEDPDRQMVPRWRGFTSTVEVGELSSLTPNPGDALTEEALRDVLEDWKREPGLSVAADLVSAAYSIGCPAAARGAAAFVLSQPQAPPLAREIAERCMSDTHEWHERHGVQKTVSSEPS